MSKIRFLIEKVPIRDQSKMQYIIDIILFYFRFISFEILKQSLQRNA